MVHVGTIVSHGNRRRTFGESPGIVQHFWLVELVYHRERVARWHTQHSGTAKALKIISRLAVLMVRGQNSADYHVITVVVLLGAKTRA